MFGSILRKKVSNEKLANVFINGILTTSQQGFPVVAEFINEDPSFVRSPQLDPENHHEFSLILLIGNLTFLESAFDAEQADAVEALIFEKLAHVYGMSTMEFKKMVKDYQQLIARLNHPSKNMLYGMSKAIFDKYQLYNYQDEYFRRMQAANPLFLKRLDEIVYNFIWDWDAFFKKYKID